MRPPGQRLSPALRAVRATLARGYTGQHEDNEAVMRYLAEEAMDIDWVVHRASIGSDGPSKGVLERSASAMSIADVPGLRLLHLPPALRHDGHPHLRPQLLPRGGRGRVRQPVAVDSGELWRGADNGHRCHGR